MQIFWIIVCWIEINMVDDLTALGLGDFAMLPLASRAFRSVSKPMILPRHGVWSAGLFQRWVCRWCRLRNLCHWTLHQISSPHMKTVRQAGDLLFVGVERVVMTAQHLIMTIAHLLCDRRSVAKFACSADDFAAPPIFRRAVASNPFVVHQAIAVGRVPPSAAIYRTRSVEFWRGHRHRSCRKISQNSIAA
jgi:hypothetical protein